MLGYYVENGMLKPNYSKLETALAYKQPKTVKDVQGIYGLLGYFRAFVPQFAAIVSPLSSLTRAGAELKWTSHHDEAIRAVLDHLT